MRAEWILNTYCGAFSDIKNSAMKFTLQIPKSKSLSKIAIRVELVSGTKVMIVGFAVGGGILWVCVLRVKCIGNMRLIRSRIKYSTGL